MCGISGILLTQGARKGDDLRAVAEAQSATLAHRGPDAARVWLDASAGIAFGHRRLSVIDLSPAGDQPMVSSCGQWVITYNGEIYNTDELRDELIALGRAFRGRSDTEVIVEGCAAWGVLGVLERLNGMFAFAVWDRASRRLFLARDRLGIKPLYWSRSSGIVIFGSEMKALLAHPDCPREIDRGAVVDFLRYGYVPAPNTIFGQVNKLAPGRLVIIPGDGGPPREHAYWDLESVIADAGASPFGGSPDEAVDGLDGLLRDAVKRQMVSDVPLGALLSGGVDSSTVTALMQAQSPRAIRTFSIGFAEQGYDESRHAAEVARHLGTDHTEMTVTPAQAMGVIPDLPYHYDEPFGDSSQIPTYLLSRLTRAHVTVALSGDGGDELFAGYTRHVLAHRFGRQLMRSPLPLRRLAARSIRSIPPRAWDAAFRLVPSRRRPSQPGDRIYKLADILPEDSRGYYRRLITQWWDAADIVPGAGDPGGSCSARKTERAFASPLEWMLYFDTVTYLPDDVLTKVDRASMAASLEARVPLLDHRVVDFAWHLPAPLKVRNGQGKWVLRQVLGRYVPPALVDRPKAGFAVPIGDWLRGPLRDWAEGLLSERALRDAGLVAPQPVRHVWHDHLSGRHNRQHELWNVLMLQVWHERWAQANATPRNAPVRGAG